MENKKTWLWKCDNGVLLEAVSNRLSEDITLCTLAHVPSEPTPMRALYKRSLVIKLNRSTIISENGSHLTVILRGIENGE